MTPEWVKTAKNVTKRVEDLLQECLNQDVNKKVRALAQVKAGQRCLREKHYSKAKDHFTQAANQNDDEGAKAQAEAGLRQTKEAGCSMQ